MNGHLEIAKRAALEHCESLLTRASDLQKTSADFYAAASRVRMKPDASACEVRLFVIAAQERGRRAYDEARRLIDGTTEVVKALEGLTEGLRVVERVRKYPFLVDAPKFPRSISHNSITHRIGASMKYNLNDELMIKRSGEVGQVIGRAEYTTGEPQYLLHYVKNGTGSAVSDYVSESLLKTVTS